MKNILNAAGIVVLFTLAACGSGQSDQQDPAGVAPEDLSGDLQVRPTEFVQGAAGAYTLARIEEEVFQGTGRRVEWNGQPVNAANAFVSMSVGGSCGATNCGKEVFLINSHESQPVRVVVTVPFTLETTNDYLAREYVLAPGEKQSIGCTHLCDGELAVDFRRAVVVAELAQAQ